MNPSEQHGLASSLAIVLFLLLLYGLAGELDCASEAGVRAARPQPCERGCVPPQGPDASRASAWGACTTSALERGSAS
jgi:hypothetical protein